jgi:hypothetical protein
VDIFSRWLPETLSGKTLAGGGGYGRSLGGQPFKEGFPSTIKRGRLIGFGFVCWVNFEIKNYGEEVALPCLPASGNRGGIRAGKWELRSVRIITTSASSININISIKRQHCQRMAALNHSQKTSGFSI